MSINELQAACKEYRELKRMAEELAAEIDEVADRIKAAMGDAETRWAGEYKIQYKPVTSSRLDTSAIKRELPDVAARYSVSTTARRFSVT